MTSPKILLFDLGGVIVPWVGLEALNEHTGLSREAVTERFAGSAVFNAYERGHATDSEFLTELSTLFDLPRDGLEGLWNSWVHAPYPGTLDVLGDLKTRFTTACLSNTNALHWSHLENMFDPDATFHHAFASHHINQAKPDAASYTVPLSRMSTAAEDVWFFDDTLVNVEAARAVGMQAFHVDRTVGVLPTLRELELI